jgi:hypothetical protein
MPKQPTGTPGKKPPAGRRRRQLVTRNRDNGAPRLSCWHAIQRSQPASHLALPAATIGKYPTALIRRSAWWQPGVAATIAGETMAVRGLDIAHMGASLNHAILFPSTHFRNIRASKLIEGTYLAADTCRMAKKPEPPLRSSWNIYKVAKKAIWLGIVEAPDKQAAIEKGAKEFKTDAWRLYAVARR